MNIQSYLFKDASQLRTEWGTVFAGEAVDDRGSAVIELAKKRCKDLRILNYDSERLEVRVNEKVVSPDDFADSLGELSKPVVVEATTLGFAEIFMLCKSLKLRPETSYQIVYVEPLDYSRGPASTLLTRRDFELSDEVLQYSGVPGASVIMHATLPQKVVFLLGYEARRLESALEENSINKTKSAVVFGVPAFRAGWEMNAFANCVKHLDSVVGGLHFCAADSPISAYRVLTTIKKECARGERLFVAPIGTKPNGIGAALFLANHEDAGVIFDYPRRSMRRTESIGKWHVFEVET